jgi:hypothetical protein
VRARQYSTPAAFKQALETRLKTASVTGLDFGRRRQLLVFERFLARTSVVFGDAATLKGGLALELRLERARTTRDVDLGVVGAPAWILDRLQEAGRLDLGDFIAFEVQPDADHPDIQSDGMQYEGMRFRAECRLAGKIYGQVFGVDVAFGEPMFGDPEIVVADDTLAFAGLAPPRLRIYPVETHIAEKLHAYTIPRSRPNSRVKDLPDLALLATVGPLEAKRLRAAIAQTFAFRNTHPLPVMLPDPPLVWSEPYSRMAEENGLPWRALADVAIAVKAFVDPILAAEEFEARAVWSPVSWRWQ